MSGTLVLAGGGKMGGALLAGWLNKGMGGADIIVVEPDSKTASAISEKHGVAVVETVGDLDADLTPETVVFAVKPQSMDDVAPAYGGYAGPDTVFLSIAAGRTIAYFEDKLGPEAAIVRAMPNAPAAVGRGITVAAANGQVTGQQKSRCDGLLGTVGDVAWIDDEGLMDAVTAVSGSGPAYVFLLIETLAAAGVEEEDVPRHGGHDAVRGPAGGDRRRGRAEFRRLGQEADRPSDDHGRLCRAFVGVYRRHARRRLQDTPDHRCR